MAFSSFASLLKESIGLDVASVGASALERAVRERQQACRLPDPQVYWERVSGSPLELQALIEAVVVAETWFFRDGEPFVALARFAHDEWLGMDRDRVVRLLSVPCATGEEPYSMAMALLDAGVPARRFRIDAVDVSERALARAKCGVYGKSSFRGTPADSRERHFQSIPEGRRVSDAVRDQVDFQQGNLFTAFASGFLSGAEVYDVIFCRNLLIYCEPTMQTRAVDIIFRLLKPRGLVFVGSSETGLFLNSGFRPAKVAMAFAFRRAPANDRTDIGPARKRRATRPPLRRAQASSESDRTDRSAEIADQSPPSPTRDLDEATRLANEGRFRDAVQRCEALMQRCGPSAGALYLLGLVRDASGDQSEAAGYYRKALYLEPDHQEALIHLALLMDRLDRKAEAQRLRARATRALARSRP